jgi:hypothetical protein
MQAKGEGGGCQKPHHSEPTGNLQAGQPAGAAHADALLSSNPGSGTPTHSCEVMAKGL